MTSGYYVLICYLSYLLQVLSYLTLGHSLYICLTILHNVYISKTFNVAGDLGQTYNSLSTLEHYIQSAGRTVLFLGDLSYADRYQYNDIGLRWDTWGRFVERSTAYQPWIWSAGNHEIDYMPNLVRG